MILPPNFGGTKGSASTEEGRHAKFFSVDSEKSNLNPGSQTEVTFSFQVPQEDEEEESDEVRVGQWIETTVTCKIKGGFFVEEMRDAEEEIVWCYLVSSCITIIMMIQNTHTSKTLKYSIECTLRSCVES